MYSSLCSASAKVASKERQPINNDAARSTQPAKASPGAAGRRRLSQHERRVSLAVPGHAAIIDQRSQHTMLHCSCILRRTPHLFSSWSSVLVISRDCGVTLRRGISTRQM